MGKIEKKSEQAQVLPFVPSVSVEDANASSEKLDAIIHFRESEKWFSVLEEIAKQARTDTATTARTAMRMGLAAAQTSLVGGLLR